MAASTAASGISSVRRGLATASRRLLPLGRLAVVLFVVVFLVCPVTSRRPGARHVGHHRSSSRNGLRWRDHDTSPTGRVLPISLKQRPNHHRRSHHARHRHHNNNSPNSHPQRRQHQSHDRSLNGGRLPHPGGLSSSLGENDLINHVRKEIDSHPPRVRTIEHKPKTSRRHSVYLQPGGNKRPGSYKLHWMPAPDSEKKKHHHHESKFGRGRHTFTSRHPHDQKKHRNFGKPSRNHLRTDLAKIPGKGTHSILPWGPHRENLPGLDDPFFRVHFTSLSGLKPPGIKTNFPKPSFLGPSFFKSSGLDLQPWKPFSRKPTVLKPSSFKPKKPEGSLEERLFHSSFANKPWILKVIHDRRNHLRPTPSFFSGARGPEDPKGIPCIKCPKDMSVTAPRGTDCVHARLPPLLGCGNHPALNTSRITLRVTHGPTPGTLLHEGRYSMVIQIRGVLPPLPVIASCPVTYDVKVRKCQPLPTLATGRAHCTAGRALGSRCVFSCLPGHSLKGAHRTVCEEVGRDGRLGWTHSVPVCAPQGCSPPPRVHSGEFTCSKSDAENLPSSPEHEVIVGGGPGSPRGVTGHPRPLPDRRFIPKDDPRIIRNTEFVELLYPIGTVCHVTCKEGHVVPNSALHRAAILCHKPGTWSDVLDQSCVPKIEPTISHKAECEDRHLALAAPIYLPLETPTFRTSSSAPAKVECDLSVITRPGTYTRTCSGVDPELGTKALCKHRIFVEEGRCSSLRSPANGELTCREEKIRGLSCSIRCYNGFSLQARGHPELLKGYTVCRTDTFLWDFQKSKKDELPKCVPLKKRPEDEWNKVDQGNEVLHGEREREGGKTSTHEKDFDEYEDFGVDVVSNGKGLPEGGRKTPFDGFWGIDGFRDIDDLFYNKPGREPTFRTKHDRDFGIFYSEPRTRGDIDFRHLIHSIHGIRNRKKKPVPPHILKSLDFIREPPATKSSSDSEASESPVTLQTTTAGPNIETSFKKSSDLKTTSTQTREGKLELKRVKEENSENLPYMMGEFTWKMSTKSCTSSLQNKITNISTHRVNTTSIENLSPHLSSTTVSIATSEGEQDKNMKILEEVVNELIYSLDGCRTVHCHPVVLFCSNESTSTFLLARLRVTGAWKSVVDYYYDEDGVPAVETAIKDIQDSIMDVMKGSQDRLSAAGATLDVASLNLTRLRMFCREEGYELDSANNVCVPCPPGSHHISAFRRKKGVLWREEDALQQEEGSLCVPCPPGSFTPSFASISCSPCPPGSFTSTTGSLSCFRCPPERPHSVSGATSHNMCVRSL